MPEEGDAGLDDEAFRDEVLGLIEDVLSGRAEVQSSEMASLPVVQTALFPDFSADELVEVIRGLELRSFEPGEIIVAEGQPGASLFVVTGGSVRTYVRDAEGNNAPVRVLGEGDFFGEVSLLEGSARTATVTAASQCELLEIDRVTLGHIARKHPRVWNVVRSFYEQRARSDAEIAARGGASTPGQK
jgi:CRP-like cAMP-binding protein